MLLLGALIWGLGSTLLLHGLAQIINRASSGQLVISGVSGSLYDTIHIQRMDWLSPTKTITVKQLDVDWSPQQLWRNRQLKLTRLSMATLDIIQKQPDNTPLTLPASLALPFNLTLPDGHILALRIQNGTQLTQLGPIDFNLNYRQQQYQLQASALSPWGKAQIQTQLADHVPFKLAGQLGLSQHDGLRNYDSASRFDGTLARINVNGNASSSQANARLQAQLTPFASVPITLANLTLNNVNPADIVSTWPQARLDAQLNLTPTGKGIYGGRLHLENHLAGTVDNHRLPVSTLDANLHGTLTDISLTSLSIVLNQRGRIVGSGHWHNEGLDLHLLAQQIDLNTLYQPLHATHLDGKLDMAVTAQRQTLHAVLNQANYNMDLAAIYQQQRLSITSAKLFKDSSSLIFSGELNLSGSRKFSAQGQLNRFNPAQFGHFPVARINADFNTQGQLQPQLQTRLQLAINRSRYNNAPLSGHLKTLITPTHVADTTAQFQLGANKLDLQGSFGAPRDQMIWQLNAPDITVFGAGWGGKLMANGTLLGSLAQPGGEMNLQGEQLAGPSGTHIAQINTRLKIDPGENGLINGSGSLRDLQMGGLILDSASVYAKGTRHQHNLTLLAKNSQFDLSSVFNGDWHKSGWRGQIRQLTNRGQLPFNLQAPANLVYRPHHLQIDSAAFNLAKGTLKLDRLDYGANGLQCQGSASSIDLGYLQQLLHPNEQIANTMTAGGKWQFTVADQIDGELSLWREKGDISLIGNQTTPLGISRTSMTMRAVNNRLSARLEANGTRLGTIDAEANTTLTRQGKRFGFSTLAPLQGRLQLQIPSLAWLTAMLDNPFKLDGALQGQLDLRGSLHNPLFSGTLSGSQLALSYPEQGVALQSGILHANFNQDKIDISQLDFRAGGDLKSHGSVQWNQGRMDMQLSATANQLKLINRPDRQIMLSGQASLAAKNRHITAEADVSIDRALLTLIDDSTPSLSNDVIVIGRNTAQPRTLASTNNPPSWLMDTHVKINLGNRTRVSGKGLDARLEGSLDLSQHNNHLPTANGTLSVAQGSYNAFGQKLDITRGILNFAGVIDNPGLDILATRTEPTVTVGVQVNGTLRAPNVKLVSTPDLNDSEKLSWLVLGHGTNNISSDADTKALQAAASYLLGKNNTVSLQSKLTQLTGLNEISVNGGGTLDSSVLSLGKRLSEKVYVNYEQGLTGARQLVKITYTLSKRFSVRAQGGNQSALDLFYTFGFD